ncbi:MAG: hypothetical protein Q8L54_15295 [Devosia sp.]|nr:hypothetical protein [Devosia sp.]
MRSDPRIGLTVSLAVAAAALLWLAARWLAADAIWNALGDTSHAVTLLCIFLLLTGLAVALLFHRFGRVRSDLLNGRNVFARWTVDPDAFKAYAGVAEARDRAEKRGTLMLMFFFIAVIFGGFALFNPEVALPMLTMAALLALLLTGAHFMGNRIRRRQLEPASGEIIVGTDGLLVNDVLHVWGVFLAWLSDVELESGTNPVLTITYAFLARYGPQYVTVMLPVPQGGIGVAEEVERRLRERLGRPPRRRASKGAGPATGSHEPAHPKGGPAATD